MFDAPTHASAVELAKAMLLSAAWKSSVLLLLAGGIARLLSRRSAALRHAVWTTALAAALAVPVLEFILPAWTLPIPTADFALNHAPSAERSSENPPASDARPGPVVAMLEGAALERAVLEQPSMNSVPGSANPRQLQIPSGHSPSVAIIAQLVPGWIVAVWLTGTIAMLARLAAGIVALQRLARRSERIDDRPLAMHLATAVRELGLGRRVTLLLSDRRAIPMTWGSFWPVLLLPCEAQNWPVDRLRIALLHELTHIQRCDYLVQLMGALARAMYWFNPLAWWGFRRMKTEIEQACDDRVLSAGMLADAYASELLQITSQFPKPAYTPSAVLAISRSARIQQRIESILDPSRNRQPLNRRFAGVLLFAAFLLTAGMASLHEVRGDAAGDSRATRAVAGGSPAVAEGAFRSEAEQPTEKSGNEGSGNPSGAARANDAPAGATDRLSEIRTRILKSYVKSPDERLLDEGAIRGMLQSLNDPHSEFLSQDLFQQMERQIGGALTGIGIQVAPEAKRLLIITPLAGSPAQAAGLKPGDAVLAVDGKLVADLGPAAATDAIRGKAGTVVVLRVERANGEEATINVTRGTIRLPSIKGLVRDDAANWSYWLDPEQKLGYIQIAEFAAQTPENCRSIVKALLEQGLKGLVVDMRRCPGGLLAAVVETADLFLREGTIVSIKGEQTPETIHRATGKNFLGDFPVMVLVDGYTASAAEIFAGALKENGRAQILGTRTFGKGSVQSILPVDGSGAIRLTTAYFYLAGARRIDRQPGVENWGVDPADGYYLPLSTDQDEQWLKQRQKREVLDGGVKALPTQGSAAILTAIRVELADPQLAAAYKSISARLAGGAFVQVGQSVQVLYEQLARRDRLLKARAEAQKQIEQIDKELSAQPGGVGGK